MHTSYFSPIGGKKKARFLLTGNHSHHWLQNSKALQRLISCVVNQVLKFQLVRAFNFSPKRLFLKNFISLFLYFYFLLSWVFVAAHGFLQLLRAEATLHCGARSSHCGGFSLLWSTGSTCVGFSTCGTRAPQLWLVGSRAQAQQLWRLGLVAPQHVGSSWTRARTRVPCTGRWILNHCATREVPPTPTQRLLILMSKKVRQNNKTTKSHALDLPNHEASLS